MLVTQKPKYDDAKKSAHLKLTTGCQQIPLRCVFTVMDLGTLRKMGFLGWWCYLSPQESCYYKPSYWAQGSIILKKLQMCQSYWKILVLNYSDILCGKTSSVELPVGGFTVFLLPSEIM